MSNPPRYLVAGCTPWAKRVYEKALSKIAVPGGDEYTWRFVEQPDDLEGVTNRHWRPRYIFFLHWRWKVPKEIVNKIECIGFHLSDLPHGRGGSPVQWAILEGGNPRMHGQEWIKAFRLTDEMDAGPIYGKALVDLHGSAEAVYGRAMAEAARIIERMVTTPGRPHPQSQEPSGALQGASTRKRRTPEDSRIPTDASLRRAYDWIRCVDAEGYPRAFLEYGGLRFEFDRAVLYDGRIKADVVITEVGDG